MQANILRKKFLSFFKSKKHKVVDSDSLAPADDPTVLFTPAGMNQFKKQFLGHITGFTRAATSQRCLRTDDLDKVGKTTGHHTFFEMLGNFSFGDYFKKEAISFAWEFLTEHLKISQSCLWVSVYKDDAEAYKIWAEQIKIPAAKIVKLGDKENFWPSDAKEKGPNGPCGPCSEIFFDFGVDKGCEKNTCSPACDCGRFVEIWNLVFTQFNRKEGGILEPLPQKNIDTGMGLERLAAVMQKAPNNFETDLFKPLIKEIVSSIKCQVSADKGIIYAISDHIRAIVFTIYDGILPSNEGRGYVVRKLIRKSTLHLRSLGIEKPFLYKLVPVLAEIMQSSYPELTRRRENISEVILSEEKAFISSLNSSGPLIESKMIAVAGGSKANFHFSMTDEELDNVKSSIVYGDDALVKLGRAAFDLYDTHGIPLELTINWLNKNKFNVNQQKLYNTFNVVMEEQKKRSKLTSSMKGDVFSSNELKLDVPATKFSGYKNYESSSEVLKIIKGNTDVKKVSAGDEATIILDKTPFYAESGGQVGDKGEIIKGKNIFEVIDTQKTGKITIHIGRVKQGAFKKPDFVVAKIDIERRLAIARNHTATHLLQAALRAVLGSHVQQQGSLVSEDKLRFDFTHFKDISQEELNRMEAIVNGYIIANHRLSAKEMPISAAKRTGALAFFGEKYENKVRVVSIGDFSKEFCGGTHLDAIGQIGILKILHEGSVASGIRRIEAVTAKTAFKLINEKENILGEISTLLNVPEGMLINEIKKKIIHIKELDKQVRVQMLDTVKSSVDEYIRKAETVNNIVLITRIIDEPNIDMGVLRNIVDLIKQKTANAVISLGANNSGKALLVMGITSDLSAKTLDASNLIVNMAKQIGGSGGGRKDFAQAGGNNPENLPKAFEELKNALLTLQG